jgi:hypothetical protein
MSARRNATRSSTSRARSLGYSFALVVLSAIAVAGCGHQGSGLSSVQGTTQSAPAPAPAGASSAPGSSDDNGSAPASGSSIPALSLPQPGSTEYDGFTATVTYETQVQSDADLGEQTGSNTDGYTNWYYWGSAACYSLDEHPDSSPHDLAQGIQSQTGFTFTGAEAVVAGAVRNLCPSLSVGYQTSMDSEVTLAQQNVDDVIGAEPDTIQTGEFAKLVCDYFAQGQGDQLNGYLQTHAVLPEPNNGPTVQYDDQALINRTVVAAATGFCPGTQIPPGWLTS